MAGIATRWDPQIVGFFIITHPTVDIQWYMGLTPNLSPSYAPTCLFRGPCHAQLDFNAQHMLLTLASYGNLTIYSKMGSLKGVEWT